MQRNININLNLTHTTVNKNSKKKAAEEARKQEEEEEQNEAQLVNQMSSFLKSLMLGSQVNKETLAEIQLPTL